MKEMRAFLILLLSTLPMSTFGQAQNYVSGIDDSLTIKKVIVVPMTDNINSVYSKPITDHVNELIQKDRQWEIISTKEKGQHPEVFEDDQKLSASLLKKYKADAMFSGRIMKGPKGITIKLSLIGGKEALPLVNDSIENFTGYETQDLRDQTTRLYENIKARMPFQGQILSRQGQTVTLDLGRSQGIKEGDDVMAVLVTKIERHPQFQFITAANREIMGRIRIYKVDDSIAFGTILEERTANLVQPKFKITRDRKLAYPDVGLTADGKPVSRIGDRPDSPVAFGSNPKEHGATPKASFGRIGLLAGLSSVDINTSNADGSSASSKNPMAPGVIMEGEMWIDPRWQFNLDMSQMAVKVTNGRTGSTPDPLLLNLQQATLTFGYNFLAREDFFGPKFQAQIGYTNLALAIDSSSPQAHTSKTYSGLLLALGGSFPIESDSGYEYLVGGKFIYHFAPGLSESPGSSGSSTNQLNQFSFFFEMGLTEKVYVKANLMFEQVNSSFSGGASNSSSANFTGIMGGIGYMF